MSLAEQLYSLALYTARPLLPLFARGEGKLARGIRGRRGLLDRLGEWANAERDPARPLVWFHAPSVGEGLQARAVIAALRARQPAIQIVYTYFSPSAESFARALPVDHADYLPFDFPDHTRRALDLVSPDVIAFTKSEVWPNLAREADRRGVRLALLSATLPTSSSRLSRLARIFLVPAYGRLDCVAAISEADAERYGELGVPPGRRRVTGDARFDQVWVRASAADRTAPFLRRLRGRGEPILVAGSTWPADEAKLLPSVRQLHDEGVRFRTILVPHEPIADHLTGAEILLDALELTHTRLSDWSGDSPLPDVLIVDRLGVLGDLYAAAGVAYVGGGWGTAGLHSVLEPAAFGAPVLFGPRHANAREAGELVSAGGAFSAANERALRERLARLILDSEARNAAGAAARAYVEAGLGAAERGAGVVEELLGGASRVPWV